MAFIPAKVNRPFILIFRVYMRHLFKRRFKAVWLKTRYLPHRKSRTLYYLNHHLWWDGLIPLLLNEYVFRQDARAIMEIDQMRSFPFFSWIGAFSIDRKNRSAIRTTLSYAIKHLGQPGGCLFIFPEGKITPYYNHTFEFEDGLAFIAKQVSDIDIVPVCSFIDVSKSDRPELYLYIDNPTKIDPGTDRNTITGAFEKELSQIQTNLRQMVLTGETADFDKLV